MEDRRTIRTLLNLKSGEITEAEDILGDPRENEPQIFKFRNKLEVQIQTDDIEHVCLYCKQPIKLLGRTKPGFDTHYFFSHLYNSDDCLIKTTSRLSKYELLRMKYNGAKESELHAFLKNCIGDHLIKELGEDKVKIDTVYRDKAISHEWRKPDVLADFGDKMIAFELQLSTTFLSVIVERTLFYKSQSIFLIWVFPTFSIEGDLQKFTQKDVYYSNSFNVYVFDQDAHEQSTIHQRLILKCFYQEHVIKDNKIQSKWVSNFVSIGDLTFDKSRFECYYYNSDLAKEKLKGELAELSRLELKKQQIMSSPKVNNCVTFLRNCYQDERFCSKYRHDNPMSKLVGWEVNALNETLKFNSEKFHVIANLFYTRDRPEFLKIISKEKLIDCDFKKIGKGGETVLEEIIGIEDAYEFNHYVACLFCKGYQLSKHETELLQLIFAENCAVVTKEQKENIRRWALIDALTKVKQSSFAFDVLSRFSSIKGLYSIKYGFPIGYNFDTLIQVSHTYLGLHKGFKDIFYTAVRRFNRGEELRKSDKTGRLDTKIIQLDRSNPKQDDSLNHILKDIFPELWSA